MNQQAKITIARLATLAAILAIGLVVSLASRDETDVRGSMNMGSNNYMGMMQAMGNMDSDAMLSRMKAILGDDDYQQMLEHMAAHRGGTVGPNGSGMDGMMQQMPDDTNHQMPMMGH